MHLGRFRIRARAGATALGRCLVFASVVGAGLLGCKENPQIPNQPPTVAIIQPTESASYLLGQSVTFDATYSDPEDGRLTNDTLAIWAMASGAFGRGLRVVRADLPVGTHEVTFSGLDSRGARGTASVRFSVTSPPVSTSTSTVSVSSPTVAAGRSINIALQARDQAGNSIMAGGCSVSFSVTGGTATGSIGATTDNGNGTYTASFTGVAAGTPTTIGATVNGVPVTSTLPTVTVTPGAPASVAKVGTDPTGLVAGAHWDSLRVIVKDANANPKPGEAVTFAVTAGGGTLSAASVTTRADGQAVVRLTTGTVTGLNTVTAAVAGLTGSPVTFSTTTVVGPISSATSTISVSAPTVAFGSAVTLTLRARDAGGNRLTVGGVMIAFVLSGGTSTGTLGPVVDSGNGTYVAAFAGVIAGTALTVGATIDGNPVSSPGQPTVTVVAGTVRSLSVGPSLIVIAPGDTADVVLRAKDSVGNIAPPIGTVLSVQPSGTASVSGNRVVGVANGVALLVATLGAAGDSSAVVVAGAEQMVVRLEWGVALARDTVAVPQATVTLDVVLDGSRFASRRIGSFTFDVTADPSVLQLDSVTSSVVPTFFVNTSQRATGVVRFGGFSTSGLPSVASVARLYVTVVGRPGSRTRISLSALDLTEVATLEDLRSRTLLADARVRVQ